MLTCVIRVLVFKQNTADGLRISDWSSDVCSSDLHAAGNDAGGDDRRHRVAGLLVGGKAEQQRTRRLRFAQEAHCHLGDDAEQSFGAGHRSAEQTSEIQSLMRISYSVFSFK